MPAPMTEMQKAFALEYATNGGNATQAAKSAGYSAKTASEQGRQLLQLPHVQEAIRKQLLRLRFDSGVIGLRALKEVAGDTKAPANARVAAARALMEHAGALGTARDVQDERDRANGEADLDPDNVIRSFLEGKVSSDAA